MAVKNTFFHQFHQEIARDGRVLIEESRPPGTHFFHQFHQEIARDARVLIEERRGEGGSTNERPGCDHVT